MSSIVLADEGARLLVEWRDRVEEGGAGAGRHRGSRSRENVEGEAPTSPSSSIFSPG